MLPASLHKSDSDWSIKMQTRLRVRAVKAGRRAVSFLHCLSGEMLMIKCVPKLKSRFIYTTLRVGASVTLKVPALSKHVYL